ncbi:pentapeptide repeat-containing protein [Amycolatopsis sp. DG1A-15b]|uniref:pentapeptide repeat-containing protein n=1 Tax=Amycolatopsis sp. DG1A-15b TaxID=3052846 RepID=UPI00255BC40B|nr:pentapeptide repeat-containing protein [Amycolatopsis sp. DG1A-15b]WIX91782.1 pentapeptide repeat-containing protein [Amycolatopsis sp. DG1A-15b]
MSRPRESTSAGLVFRGQRPARVSPRSLFLHVGLLLLLATAVAVGFGTLLWLGLGSPNVTAPSTPTTGRTTAPPALTAGERLEALKVILAVVAGIGAVVALTVAYRKQRDAELAEYREDAKAYADRFGKAADQLGNAEYVVRTGGVYALAELADEWIDGRQTCIDLLCAYLRMPYVADTASADYSDGNREVRRIIIRVIRNHLRDDWSAVSWRGYRFSFEGAVFDCGDFSKAHFRGGNVTFHKARFVAGHVEFNDVEFEGTPVWFSGVEFAGAFVDFRRATFAGTTTSFKGAVFSAGRVEFDDAHFSAGKVDFDGVTHTGGTVGWGPFPEPSASTHPAP